MSKRWHGLEAELKEAGFSTRTIHALTHGLGLQSLDELITAEWGALEDRKGLAWTLSRLHRIGAKGIAEVQAFRETGDARKAAEVAPTTVTVRLDPGELRTLDHWAIKEGLTRGAAVRTLLVGALARAKRR